MSKLKPLWLHLEPIAARLKRATAVCLATDFDGTLAPIVEHPDRAAMPERPRAALGTLIALGGVHVAILSGRRVQDLRERLELPGAYLAGVGGLEVLDESGKPVEGPPLEPVLSSAARADMEAWCAQFPGAWIEDKGPAVTIHYRAVASPRQPAFCAGARRRLSALRKVARVTAGKKVYELLPGSAPDKADAFQHWLGRNDPAAIPFYFGDESSDEAVHAVARRLGGIAVAIGRTASRAEYGIGSPAQLAWFLEWLGREWSIMR